MRMPSATVRPRSSATESKPRTMLYFRWILAVCAQVLIAAVLSTGVMSLDKHFAVFFVYGQQGANISRNEIFRVPVWSVAAWVAAHYTWDVSVFQGAMFILLPILGTLRACMGWGWCFDGQLFCLPSLIALQAISVMFITAHCLWFWPDEPAKPAEKDPLMDIDWEEVAAENARWKAHFLAGYVPDNLFTLSSRGQGPLCTTTSQRALAKRKASLTGLSSVYTAAFGDHDRPFNSKSGQASDSESMDAPSATLGSLGNQGSKPDGKGISSYYIQPAAEGNSAMDDLQAATRPKPGNTVESTSTPHGAAEVAGMARIIVGSPNGTSPVLSITPILPRTISTPVGNSTNVFAAKRGTSSQICAIPTPTQILTDPSPSSVGSRESSFVARLARQPSTGTSAAAGIPAIHSSAGAAPKQPAVKAGTAWGQKAKKGVPTKEPIPISANAETLPATTPKLLKQSSSLKEKYAKMKIHLADLTTEVKSRTKKSKNNRPAPEHPEESNSRTGNNLERGNSWQAAAKAVKGGFSRRKSVAATN